MLIRLRAAVVAALSFAAFAACSMEGTTALDRSAQIAPPTQAAKALAKPPKGKVDPLHRDAKLPGPLSASQTIGPAGGMLAIPSAGVTLTVPSGALLVPVKITMTALAGDAIAYEFAPHGLVFLKPATLTQALQPTHEKGPKGTKPSEPMELGYFTLPSQVTSLIGDLDELRGGTETATSFTSSIWHFSGYAIGCGRR